MMANKVTMKLEGLQQLQRNLMALPVELDKGKVLMRALHDGARIIAAEVKRLAPVLKDPGRNPHRQAGAIRANITQHGSKTEDFAVVIRVRSRGYIFGNGKGADSHRRGNPNYWWLQEFGTSQAAAQPFMRPAFESQKFRAAQEIRNSLRRGIDFVVRRLSVRRAA